MGRLFGSLFSSVATVLIIIWLSILATAGGLLYYLSYHWEPVAGVAMVCGITLTLSVWSIFSAIDFMRDAVRGAQETRRFQADQKADALMLQAQAQHRSAELMELQRQARLQREQLALEGDYRKLNEAIGEPVAAVSVEDEGW